MKRISIIIVGVFAACLLSCKTHKTVTTSDLTSTAAYVDTTKLVGDTASHKVNALDTTKTAAAFEGSNVIEFVESGGKVNIAPDGNVTLEGVKNMRGQHKGSVAQE